MTLQEHLLNQAMDYWEQNMPLPLDLFYKMLDAGIDVEVEEHNYYFSQESN